MIPIPEAPKAQAHPVMCKQIINCFWSGCGYYMYEKVWEELKAANNFIKY